MKDTYCLSANPVEAHKSLAGKVWQHIKALTVAGHRVDVTVKPATRSGDQNRKLHAMLGEIAAQKEWAGSKRDSETWKRLLTAAWTRARGEHTEFLPSIDGVGIDIVFRRTSSLTRGEMSELIEFVYAWGAEAGVVFTEIDMETGEILSSQRPYRLSDGC